MIMSLEVKYMYVMQISIENQDIILKNEHGQNEFIIKEKVHKIWSWT